MAKKIYVGNLSFQTTETDLRNMFGEFGQVESVQIITDRDTGRAKGFGFVQMADDAAAEKAIVQLNGKGVGGRNLTVNEARPMEKGDFKGGSFSARAPMAVAMGWTTCRSNAAAMRSAVSWLTPLPAIGSTPKHMSWPVVRVPVLSSAIWLQLARASSVTPPFSKIPFLAHAEMALK